VLFRSVDEASALVLQAAASDADTESSSGVYVLDMGDPVRIEHLARQLCRLRGLEPDRDIAIIHTGLRPGEKVHEKLFYRSETVQSTGVDGVLLARAPREPMEQLKPKLDALALAASERDRAATIAALAVVVPQFGVDDDPD